MAQVKVTINGRGYDIACDDGEEGHVETLGRFVDEKVAGLVSEIGQVGDSRLLVMATLLICDELYEAYAKLEARGKGGGGAQTAVDGDAAEHLAAMARRIDDIAASIEGA